MTLTSPSYPRGQGRERQMSKHTRMIQSSRCYEKAVQQKRPVLPWVAGDRGREGQVILELKLPRWSGFLLWREWGDCLVQCSRQKIKVYKARRWGLGLTHPVSPKRLRVAGGWGARGTGGWDEQWGQRWAGARSPTTGHKAWWDSTAWTPLMPPLKSRKEI